MKSIFAWGMIPFSRVVPYVVNIQSSIVPGDYKTVQMDVLTSIVWRGRDREDNFRCVFVHAFSCTGLSKSLVKVLKWCLCLSCWLAHSVLVGSLLSLCLYGMRINRNQNAVVCSCICSFVMCDGTLNCYVSIALLWERIRLFDCI